MWEVVRIDACVDFSSFGDFSQELIRDGVDAKIEIGLTLLSAAFGLLNNGNSMFALVVFCHSDLSLHLLFF